MGYDIINQLQLIVNRDSDGDVSGNIAKALLQSIHKDIEGLTISELAERGYTSVSSISRFAKSLNCDSFNELKKKCIEGRKVSKTIIEDNLENMNFTNRNDKEILRDFVESISRDLKTFVENIDLKEIDELIELIHDYNEINFFGIHLSGNFMEYLQYLFLNIGKYINFKELEIEQEILAQSTTKDSLSIIFSVDGNYLHSNSIIFYKLKENGGQIVLVTQNPALKLSNKCDKVIYLGNYTNAKNGRYKLQLFSEIIINRYYLKYKEESKI